MKHLTKKHWDEYRTGIIVSAFANSIYGDSMCRGEVLARNYQKNKQKVKEKNILRKIEKLNVPGQTITG